jgi:hypothetical protein
MTPTNISETIESATGRFVPPPWPDHSDHRRIDMALPIIEQPGTRYGRLVVIADAGYLRYPHRLVKIWLCRCDCGKEKAVKGTNLRNGVSRSCGCLQREVAAKTIQFISITHGQTKNGKPTSEYDTWSHIKSRCLNPSDKSYRDYGGRGITVCPEWLGSFETFLAYVGPKPSPLHSIDRIDNSGNYEPGNVRWAVRVEQNRNKRNNLIIEFLGESKILVEWAVELKIATGTLRSRLIKYGWTVERAFTTPVVPGGVK